LIISLALVSTVFDFVFFALFYKPEATLLQQSILQTMWFIESILTEILLIFVIRTSGFFLKAKFPSKPLAILSLVTIITTISLPFTKFGQEFFHFISPTASSLIIVFFLLFGYLLMSEIVKLIYFKRYDRKNNKC